MNNYWETVMMSKQYSVLSARARLLLQYCYLVSDCSKKDFNFERELWLKKFRLYRSDNGQFNKDMDDLIAAGFIKKVYSGASQRKKNIYRICNDWVNGKSVEKPSSGYVYLVKMGEHYKIGISKQPSLRLKEFTLLPYPLEKICIKKVNNYKNCEEELHKIFAKKRVRGEWFSLEEKDIAFIKDYLQKRVVQNGRGVK